MSGAETIAYTEPRQGLINRPYLTGAPKVYQQDGILVEELNRGEHVTEEQAFSSYFARIEYQDPLYMQQIKNMVKGRALKFPEATEAILDRSLQLVVPAYREGENMSQFLDSIKQQFEQSSTQDWGVTFVIDYATPYTNSGENAAREEMHHEIARFLEQNSQYRSRVDWIFYVRDKNIEPPVLPVGLARKIGEDVLMYEKLQALKQKGNEVVKPLYLGLMDMDTTNLSAGLLQEMVKLVPSNEIDKPRVIRVKGSFDKAGIKESPHLLPLQMMWEDTTSKLGRTTKHNSFNVGRLSAVPARELAITGGGFARKLGFTDEDVRQGIQIALLVNINTVEPKGHYATSPRREVHTMDGVLQLVHDHGGVFDMETLGVAALIRMYGNWGDNVYRNHLGNGNGEKSNVRNAFSSIEAFTEAVPPKLIEVMANAFYRFTATSIYAIDELYKSPFAPEIKNLINKFLRGEIAYFDVQLQTMDFIGQIVRDPERFQQLKPVLEIIDGNARKAVAEVLRQNGIDFSIDEAIGPIYGLSELNVLQDASIYTLLRLNGNTDTEIGDRIRLAAPFHIAPDQPGYMDTVRRQLETN